LLGVLGGVIVKISDYLLIWEFWKLLKYKKGQTSAQSMLSRIFSVLERYFFSYLNYFQNSQIKRYSDFWKLESTDLADQWSKVIWSEWSDLIWSETHLWKLIDYIERYTCEVIWSDMIWTDLLDQRSLERESCNW